MPTSSHPAELARPLMAAAVARALEEDLGLAGDLTSLATLAPDLDGTAAFVCREEGILCGMDFVAEAFAQIDPNLAFIAAQSDGARVDAGTVVGTVSGKARSIFSAERVGLNFLNHLSGIATLTRSFVDTIKGTNARICDTRKTTPGLRAFEKYAVRCGGGVNHRFGLDDAILIKDNHIAVCGGVAQAMAQARAYAGHMVAIEIEVDTLDQLGEALEAGANAILLDNMRPADLRRAVSMTQGRARLEASGGVTLQSVRAIAETGVDFISSSRITMAATPLDIGLDVTIAG